jgi:hypothetical protein
MTTQPTFEKVIRYDRDTRDYVMYVDGELIGFARTHHEAEVTLDQIVFDRLAHGDCATATELDGGDVDTIPDGASCQCRTCIQPATHNVNGTLACCFHYSEELTGVLCNCTDDDADAAWESDHGSYNGKVPSDFTSSEADPPSENPMGDEEGDSVPSAVNWNSATANQTDIYPICESCNTAEFPPSCIIPGSCVSCANARYWGLANRFAAAQFAVTRQSLAIEAKLTTCGYCTGIHHIQKCPELRDHVRASDADWRIAVGRKLCAMFWREHTAFVALLLSASPDQLLMYATDCSGTERIVARSRGRHRKQNRSI